MTKEKSLLFFFTLTHTLIISFKGENTLLSPFYFLLHAQFSLGCLLFSKWPTLGCSLSFFLCGFLFLCFCTYCLCVFWKAVITYSLLSLVFLLSENQNQSQKPKPKPKEGPLGQSSMCLLVSRSICLLPIGRTLGPKPKPKAIKFFVVLSI